MLDQLNDANNRIRELEQEIYELNKYLDEAMCIMKIVQGAGTADCLELEEEKAYRDLTAFLKLHKIGS